LHRRWKSIFSFHPTESRCSYRPIRDQSYGGRFCRLPKSPRCRTSWYRRRQYRSSSCNTQGSNRIKVRIWFYTFILSVKKLGSRIDFDIYYEAITALLKYINLKRETSILYEKIIKIDLRRAMI